MADQNSVYATHYGTSVQNVIGSRTAYAILKNSGSCFVDERTYLDSVFGTHIPVIRSGDDVEDDEAPKTAFTRTQDTKAVEADEDPAPEKAKFLRGVLSRVSRKDKGDDDDDGGKKKLAIPVNTQALKDALSRVQENVVPRAKQAVTTISPYLEKGAREAFEFAKPIVAKGAEMGGDALKQVMEFVLQSLLPLLTQVITDTLSQLLSALISALVSAIGSGVKSLIIAGSLDRESSPPLVNEYDRDGSSFYYGLAKLFEMADIADVIDGRTTKSLRSGMFCVQNTSGRPAADLRGVLWFFVNVKRWISPEDFDRLFLGELVRAQLRADIFGTVDSPVPIHSGDRIPTGDLQTSLQQAILARRSAWAPDDEPSKKPDTEPSAFDDETDVPPPMPERDYEQPSTPAPPPPAPPPPPMTNREALAFYQSPPVPPPVPTRPQIKAAPVPVPQIVPSVQPPAVSVTGQSWAGVEKELASYLDPRIWGTNDYIADPPAAVRAIAKLRADPTKPQDPAVDVLLDQAEKFYRSLSKDMAARTQAMQVLGVEPTSGVDSMRALENITSGFLDDPQMIATLSDYVLSAQSRGTFSTTTVEAIIKDFQSKALADSKLGLSDADIRTLLDTYAPQTHNAALKLLNVVLKPANPAPPSMNVRPEAAMSVVQVADTMTPYIAPPPKTQNMNVRPEVDMPVVQVADTPTPYIAPPPKTPMTRSGISGMFGSLGSGLSGLITNAGGAFGKLAKDTLTSPAVQGTILDVTKVASEAASQAIVTAGSDAIREATRTKTPEEIQEAQRLRRESAEAKKAVEAEKRAEREAKAATKSADAAKKRAEADEIRKARMKEQEEKRSQQKAAADAKKAADAEKAAKRKAAADAKKAADAENAAKRKAATAAAKSSKAKTPAKPKPAAKPKPKSQSKPKIKPKPKSQSRKTRATRSGNGMTQQEEELVLSGDLQIVDDDIPMSKWPVAGAMRVGAGFDSDDDDNDDSDGGDDSEDGGIGLRIAYMHDSPVRIVRSGEHFDGLSAHRSILAAYQDPEFYDVVQGRSHYYNHGPFTIWNPSHSVRPDLEMAVADFVDDMSKGLHFGSPLDGLIKRKGAESGGSASLRAWAKQATAEYAQPGAPGPAAVVAAFMNAAKASKEKLMPTAIAARVTTAVHALALGVEALATIERPNSTGMAEAFPLLSEGTEMFTSMIQAVTPAVAPKTTSGALFGKKAATPAKPKEADPAVLGKNIGIYLFNLIDKTVRSNSQTMSDELSDDAVAAALGPKSVVNDASLARAKMLIALFGEVVQNFLLDPDFATAAADGLVRVLLSPRAMVLDQDKADAFKARMVSGNSLNGLLGDGAYDTAMRAGHKISRDRGVEVHMFVPEGDGPRMVFRNNAGYRDAHTVIGNRVYGGGVHWSIDHRILADNGAVGIANRTNELHAPYSFWEHGVDSDRIHARRYTPVHMDMVDGRLVHVNRE
jgi:hypothetical protein